MALVCATPHGKSIAVAGEPADFRIEDDATPKPGAKVTEREHRVAQESGMQESMDALEQVAISLR
jgi:hypothetical protein